MQPIKKEFGFSFVVICGSNELNKLQESLSNLPNNVEIILVINEVNVELEYNKLDKEFSNDKKQHVKRVVVGLKELDFSKLRNIGLKYCSKEWIISLDSDDIFSWTYKELDNLRHVKDDVGGLNCPVTYKIDNGDKTPIWVFSQQVKIFRNNPLFIYEYAVHERVEENILKAGYKLEYSNLLFRHLGYNNTNDLDSKLKRNKDILERELKITPLDNYLKSQLDKLEGLVE